MKQVLRFVFMKKVVFKTMLALYRKVSVVHLVENRHGKPEIQGLNPGRD